MEILLNIFLWVIGIVVSWYVTHRYYLKSLKDQRESFLSAEVEYRRIIEKFVDQGNSDLAINKKLLEEKRIEQCVQRYAQTGGGDLLVRMIDTYSDLSNMERADLLDTVLIRGRGRKAKDNPFREKEEGRFLGGV